MLSAYRLLADDYRGKRYFVAPGNTQFRIREALVTPDDFNSGLYPLAPLASVNKAFSLMQAGDTLVLMKEGDYTLTANVNSSLANIKMLAWPGLHPRLVAVRGIAGAPPLELTGRGVYLGGFSIKSGDAAQGDLVLRGDFSVLEKMHLVSDGVITPTFGLKLIPAAATESASRVRLLGCEFEDTATGLLFGFQAGAFTGSASVLADGCRFRKHATRAIGQEASNTVDALSVLRSSFEGPLGTDFINLANAGNGAVQLNTISDNVFADAAIAITDVVLTAARFFFTGNRDKAGFITTIGA